MARGRKVVESGERVFFQNLRQRIVDILETAEMTIYQLAKVSGVSTQNLSNFLDGVTATMQMWDALKIATALGLTLGELVDFDNEPEIRVYVTRTVRSRSE